MGSRLPVVGVMGSSRERSAGRAEALGRWLATQDVHLLTGGGGGVMEAVSRAFHRVENRRGLVIGIVPGARTEEGYAPWPDYPNRWVELPIYTHLPLGGEQGAAPLSRNHINVLSSDVVVALPGSAGTATEVALALTYGRPVVAYLSASEDIPGLPAETLVEPDFTRVQQFVLRQLHNET